MNEHTPDPNYEKIVHKLAFAAINEQRRARRWRIFFLLLFFIYLTPVLVMILDIGSGDSSATGTDGDGKHTAKFWYQHGMM